jgi:hypothetical protein
MMAGGHCEAGPISLSDPSPHDPASPKGDGQPDENDAGKKDDDHNPAMLIRRWRTVVHGALLLVRLNQIFLTPLEGTASLCYSAGIMEDEKLTGKENDDDEPKAGDEAPSMMMGVQPIEAIMTEHGLKNHDVVQMNRGGLTHKNVAKARKGRKLTPKIKVRVTEALNAVLKQRGIEKQFVPKDLFNY